MRCDGGRYAGGFDTLLGMVLGGPLSLLAQGAYHTALSPVYLVRWQRRRRRRIERRLERQRIAEALEIASIERERRAYRAKRKRATAKRWRAYDSRNGIHLSH